MLNQINLMGRLVRDPEMRTTQQGTPVASFTLAVDRDGGKDKGCDFIDCVAWRNTAEFVSKYFQKGSMAAVSGRLCIRDWTDKDGNKRKSAEVVVASIYFGSSKASGGEAPQQAQPTTGVSVSYTEPQQAVTRTDPLNDLKQFDNVRFVDLDTADGGLPF